MSTDNPAAGRERALKVILEQLAQAVEEPKCHPCGCLHAAVVTLEETELGAAELASALAQARSLFVPQEYDCLGCSTCYPAIAANAIKVV
jgi:tetrahydromethanopterin S-methyltransferase subunit A